MKFGSLFSGVGGLDLGLERAGFECAWQAEKDKYCLKVLEEHFPDAERYDDVRSITRETAEPVDLICGGFPCQDVSVAGKRNGLSGARSGLWFEFERIIREFKPKWVLIENVGGLLSSNSGEDFRTIIQTLDELGYGVAWRVLDSQYFGVPQRRKRVFIVGSLGNTSCGEVLFEPESLSGDFAPSGEQRKEATSATLRSGGSGGIPSSRGENIVAYWDGSQTSDTLDVSVLSKGQMMPEKRRFPVIWEMHHASEVYRGLWTAQNRPETYKEQVAPTLQARMGTGGNNIPLVGVRKLTPLECERLQGFPQIKESMEVEICLDHQKKNALVGMKNLKLLKHAKSVENVPQQGNARFAESNLVIKNQQTEKHAHLNVLINCEVPTLQILNQEKLLLNVNGAEKKSLYPQHIQIEDFVQISALMSTILEKGIRGGREELLQRERFLTRVKSGENLESIYGEETMLHVEDVVRNLLTLNKPMRVITSDLLKKYPSDLILIMLYYFVLNVIALCIQKEIQEKNLLAINFEMIYGWTFNESDTQRYRQMGNAVTVNVAEWVAKRIKPIADAKAEAQDKKEIENLLDFKKRLTRKRKYDTIKKNEEL